MEFRSSPEKDAITANPDVRTKIRMLAAKTDNLNHAEQLLAAIPGVKIRYGGNALLNMDHPAHDKGHPVDLIVEGLSFEEICSVLATATGITIKRFVPHEEITARIHAQLSFATSPASDATL